MSLTLQELGKLQLVNEGHYFDESTGIFYGPRTSSSLLPEAFSKRITPRGLIFHSNAAPHRTPLQALKKYVFRLDITIEPHFDLGLDGIAEQWVPVTYKADCNAKANQYVKNGITYGAVSVESEDEGSASLPTTPWSLGQLSFLIALGTALAIQFGNGCQPCALWDDYGIDYHCKHKEWSIYSGKTCPGAARIRQMPYIQEAVKDRVVKYHQLIG